ncbi:MAG TPA: carboxypeptidase-like regulatory domain-containing protein, partial [Terriglobales bacterium]
MTLPTLVMGYPVIGKHFSACFMHPQLGENMYPRARGSLCFCVLLLSLQLTLFAQSDLGTISGFVRDQSGAIIPNAKVIVRNQSGIERAVNTNDSGFYIITNIPAGFYTLNVEAPGFQKYQSNNNKLDPSTRLSIDVPLTVGTATQTIEVTANAATLQTESASVQQLVTRQQIDSLELNGRNPVGLAALVPGARSGTLAQLNFNFFQGPQNFNGS